MSIYFCDHCQTIKDTETDGCYGELEQVCEGCLEPHFDEEGNKENIDMGITPIMADPKNNLSL